MFRKLNNVHLAQLGGQLFSLGLFQLRIGCCIHTGSGSHHICCNWSGQPPPAQPEHLCLLCEGDGGAGLPVDQTSQLGLPLDNAVGNPHLTAQGRQDAHHVQLLISCAFLFSPGWSQCYSSQRTGGSLVGKSPFPDSFFSAWANNLFSRFVSDSVLVGQLQHQSCCLALPRPR